MTAATDSPLSPTSRAQLGRLIGSLADNKAALGRRYGEWAVSAPTLESAVAAAAMAQDELGHARSSYPLLKHLDAGDDTDPDRMEIGGCLPILAAELPNWETFTAVNLVIDGFFTAFVRTAQTSSYGSLAQRSRKILQEERAHGMHAAAWSRRLAQDPAHRRAFEGAVRECWRQILDWPDQPTDFEGLAAASVLSGAMSGVQTEARDRVAGALGGIETISLPWS